MFTVRILHEEVMRYFDELEVPSSTINLKHPFVRMVVITLMAVLAGANGLTTIAQWVKHKKAFLPCLLDLPQGVSQRDVLRRVLSPLYPAAFQAWFSAPQPRLSSPRSRAIKKNCTMRSSIPSISNSTKTSRAWALAHIRRRKQRTVATKLAATRTYLFPKCCPIGIRVRDGSPSAWRSRLACAMAMAGD